MDTLFEYLTSLSSHAAYWIIFGILVACGLGFPLPEDIPLIAAGYLVWDGTMQWGTAIGITILGVLVGDTCLFYLGRKLGLKMLDNPKVQTLFKPAKVRRTRAYFRKYGDKIIFFARFVAGFRAAAFFMSGAMKVPYRKFLWLDALAALLSVPIWIAIGYAMGYYLGDEISQIMLKIKEVKTAFTVVIFVVFTVVIGRAIYKYRNAKRPRRKVTSTP